MKRAFTLVETIGVIILLSVIALIATPLIEKEIKKGQEQAYEIQIDNIELALKNWASDNQFIMPYSGQSITLTLGQLKQAGYIDKNIKNPITKKLFPNDMILTITNDGKLVYDVLDDTGTATDLNDIDIDAPIIVLNGNILEYAELGVGNYTDLGATAKDKDGNTIEVTNDLENPISLATLGTHTITYTATSNDLTSTIKRTVIVRDTTAPQLTIPVEDVTIYANQVVDLGTTLLNNVSATDISGASISIINNVSSAPGTYTITYVATDTIGNITSKNRNVIVLSTDNPIISYNPLVVTITHGENYDLLNGVSAIDANHRPISTISCSINNASCTTTGLSIGTYTVTYTATDTNNKTTTVTRILNVK